MTLEVRNIGTAHGSGEGIVEQSMHQRDGRVVAETLPGAVVYQERLLQFNPEVHPFLNDDFGINMNQNISFGGTPVGIHNGIDSTLWTGSNIAGASVTFNQDDDRAHGGIVTVVTAADTGGDTVTVGVNGVDTIVTEGVEWTKTDGNNTATATSLASAISAISGVSATSALGVVTVVIDSGNNISKIDTSDGTALPGSARAVFVNQPAVNNVWEFDQGSDITIASYTAFTCFVNIDKNWSEGDSVEMYAYDTGTATEVGQRIKVEDFINFGDFDTWQSFTIPFSAFTFIETTFDAIRFEMVAKSGASPTWYLDDFQIEQTGVPLVFKATTPKGTKFHVDEIRIRLRDTISVAVANGTVPGWDTTGLLGVSALTNGILFQRTQDGEIEFSVLLRSMDDFEATGSNRINESDNGSISAFTYLVEFPNPIILDGSKQDFLSFTIQDALDGLDRLTAVARGSIEI